MLTRPTNFKTKQEHPMQILKPAVKKICKTINYEDSFFILGADSPNQEQISLLYRISVVLPILYSQHCSWKHLWEFYGYLLHSLLSCGEDLRAGHVLLLQGYLFSYWLKIKMVIYASIRDHCNVLFHWFCGSSLHALNSLCETLTARSFQTSHSQFGSLQLPTTPNH